VNPGDGQRYYLGRPADAFAIMKTLGLGISNENIAKIPIGVLKSSGYDDDNDGLINELEVAIGTNPNSADTDNDDYSDQAEVEAWHNPNGTGKLPVNIALVNKLKGRILLQVQEKGAAWYLNPKDSKRYFLGRPQNAFEIMYNLGIGISNAGLAKISSNYVQTAYKADGHYEIKYPSGWNKKTELPESSNYTDLTTTHNLVLTPGAAAVYLEVAVLESSKDYTLGNFYVEATSSTDKPIDQDLMIGIKPAKKQKIKYNSNINFEKSTMNKGAEIFGDVMISTKKFIHLRMVILNEKDITLYEGYFDKIFKSLKLFY